MFVYPLLKPAKRCYNIGMIIDKIETKRNKTTVFCGEKSYSFHPQILSKYDVKEGEIDAKKFFEAKNESDRLLCRRQLYALIDRSEKSKNAYIDALTNRGHAYKIAAEEADEAEKRGLIDDRRYAECYLHLHEKAKGWYRIANELKAKGVPAEIVDELKEDFGDHTEECARQAEKIMKGQENTYENRQKAYAKLMRKGFSSDEIVRALEKYGSGSFDE